MNKKDCENIEYILSTHRVSQHLLESFFGLDVRIEPEFELFEEAQGRSDEIIETYAEMMCDKFGPNWSYNKNARLENKKIYDSAVLKVNGHDRL